MHKIAGLLFSILPIACAILSSPRELIISQPYETVWEESIIIIGTELKLPIMDVDKQSGRITTSWVTYTRPPRDYDEQLFGADSSFGMHLGVPIDNLPAPNKGLPIFQNPIAVQVRFTLDIYIKKYGEGTRFLIHGNAEKKVYDLWESTIESLPIIDEISSKLKTRFNE